MQNKINHPEHLVGLSCVDAQSEWPNWWRYHSKQQ